MRRAIALLLVLAFAAWTLYTSVTQVQPYQRGVIRRFGKVLQEKPQPGLHIGLPWGMDRVDLAPVNKARILYVGFQNSGEAGDESTPAGQMLTGDHNLVNVQAVLNFNVRDVEDDIVRYVLNQDAIDAFVSRAAESLMAEWIAAQSINHIIQQGRIELPRFLQERLQDRIDAYGLGVEVSSISIPILDPPDEVRDAFDRVAQAKNTRETLIVQAKQFAKQRESQAEAKAYDLHLEAHAYASVQHTEAETEAAKFLRRLDQYRELSRANPDYINALWLDEITRGFSRMKAEGRIELLDHYLSKDGLSILQIPLGPRKK
jgi:membrane protease subunit HflK